MCKHGRHLSTIGKPWSNILLVIHEVLDKAQLTMEAPKRKCILENLFVLIDNNCLLCNCRQEEEFKGFQEKPTFKRTTKKSQMPVMENFFIPWKLQNDLRQIPKTFPESFLKVSEWTFLKSWIRTHHTLQFCMCALVCSSLTQTVWLCVEARGGEQ